METTGLPVGLRDSDDAFVFLVVQRFAEWVENSVHRYSSSNHSPKTVWSQRT